MHIKCDGLTMSYEGKDVISNLSFSIKKGDYLCIVGENGSGKSTLANAILGLKKPSSGSLFVNADAIGYLPQKTALKKDFPASVFEVVLSGCIKKSLLPFYTKAQKKTASYAMEKLGISNLKNVCCRNLSGGQQQRMFLARALCAAEDMLLLDEPVTGLDPVASIEMYEIIKELHKKGTTIIMISHDIGHALKNATHILHLSESDYFFGSSDEYLKSDLLKSFKGGNL